jgi:hypothetical protein
MTATGVRCVDSSASPGSGSRIRAVCLPNVRPRSEQERYRSRSNAVVASAARSGPAGDEAEATSAMRRGTYGLLGPRRATLDRTRSASARTVRGLHVSEDRTFGA